MSHLTQKKRNIDVKEKEEKKRGTLILLIEQIYTDL